ncbi:MAG TPA: CvpA family protein [Terriglobales bacterium]|jgi:membrane protein required for colicin V production
MTGIDWVIVVAVTLSMALAAKEGFFYEIFSLAGVVAGYLLAAWEYGRVAGWFSPYTRAQWVAEIGAFLLIFIAVVGIAGLAGRITRWALKEVGLRWFDRLLGAAFGLLRGVLVIAVVALALASFTPGIRFLSGSVLGPYFLSVARAASWVAPATVRDRFRQGMDGLRHVGQPSAPAQVLIPAPAQQK